MTVLLNQAMLSERETHLQAKPYERSEARQGYSNGFKAKTLNTRYGELKVRVPQTREIDFYPGCLEKGLRSERALYATLASMYIEGVSTRKLTKVLETMCGLSVSSTQVSRCTAKLDEHLTAWRNRPLGSFRYIIADARYETVRYGGHAKDLAIIWAIGVTQEGQKEVLGMTVSLSEAEVHWRDFFIILCKRGLTGVNYIVSDDHQGLRKALKSVFPGTSWQRCQFHLAQNAQAYISKKHRRPEIAQDIRDISQSPDLHSAHAQLNRFIQKWEKSEPKLVSWAEQNIPQGFAVFSLPKSLHKKFRTSNLIERFNQELKRRSKLIRIFPNEESCLRLLSAVALEFHEDWLSKRRFFSTDDLID
jgi:putative transposase